MRQFKVIDLSIRMVPGVRKVSGEYRHGELTRRLEIRQFLYREQAGAMASMHWIDAESHIGTHVEGPSHFKEELQAVGEMPLETFMGEAVLLRFVEPRPVNGVGQPIKPEHLERVRGGDIVLMWSPYEGADKPYVSPEAARALFEKRVKLVGFDMSRVGVEAPGCFATHENLLGNGIPVIEGLTNLEALEKERFFFVAFPIRIAGLDSSWVRAVALEPL